MGIKKNFIDCSSFVDLIKDFIFLSCSGLSVFFLFPIYYFLITYYTVPLYASALSLII